MLANSHKHHRHVRRVDQTDKGTDHVTDGVALGDDEAVQGAIRAKGRIKVACLGNGVCSYKSLGI